MFIIEVLVLLLIWNPFDVSTSENCKDNRSSTFKCTPIENFEDVDNSTCIQYYLCKQNSSLYIMYTAGTPVNSETQLCSETYVCKSVIQDTSESEIFNPTLSSLFTGDESYTYGHILTSDTIFFETTSVLLSDTPSPITELIIVNESDTTIPVSVDLTTMTTDAITKACSFISDPNYFKCSATGRFQNLNDLTCQTYFLCSLLRNGSYSKTTYNCPENSYFNPTLHVCDISYTCPCENIPTDITSNSLVTSSLQDVTELPTITTSGTNASITTVNNTDAAASVSVTLQSTKATTETCNYTNNLYYFECKSRGRFSNQNDPTCKTYFMCSLLKNGSYLKTTYNCPGTSYFNPLFHVCDTSYTCPCANLVLTTIVPSSENVTELPTVTISGYDLSITTLNNTAATESITGRSTESAIETCNYTNNLNYFECKSTGRYSNQNDLTCKTYFLCSMLRNGSYMTTTYNCPDTSYFNPIFQVCDTSYICPCAELTLTTIISSTVRLTELSTVTLAETTESITTVNNSVTAASTTLATEAAESCNFTSDTNYFQCNSSGRFSNQNDWTCQTYFLCSLLRNGSYLKTIYNCPENSYFSPTFHVCDTGYTCPCENLLTTVIPSSENITELPTITISGTDVSITTVNNTDTAASVSVTVQSTEATTETCNYTSNLNYFECKSRGRFANQNDPTCKTYFMCSLLRNGSYLKTKYDCPDTSYFNQIFQVCDTTYICPCAELILTTTISLSEGSTELSTVNLSGTAASITTVNNSGTAASTTLATEATESCNFSSDTIYFQCNSTGRFSNQNDLTCQTYFLCSLLRNGSYLKTIYNCPDSSYFNPTFRVCDTSYTCPCENILTIATSSSENITELPTITISETDVSITTVTNTDIAASVSVTVQLTETTTETCNYTSNLNYFECKSRGRFSNQNDPTCKTYFLCSLLRNGSYLKAMYNCPGNSYFNPTFNVCDTDYTCPCENLRTTAIASSEDVTELPTITISGTDVSITTVNNTDTAASVSVTVQSTEATTETCNYTSNLNYFECKSRGRFANQNDPTCKTYFMCSLLRNGSYLKTKYDCPDTSYFNPIFQVCDTTYICPCAELILTTTISLSEGSTELSTVNLSGTAASITTVNNSGTAASTTLATEATESCNFSSDTIYFQCNSTGRFSNQNDLTCQTYFLCSLLRNGSYLKTIYNCPDSSYFNPTFRVCDTSYTCPCENILTIATSSSENITELPTITISETDVSITTVTNTDIAASVSVTVQLTETTTETCNYTSNLNYFECKSRGRFSNQNDPTCKTYFLCSLLRNGSYLKAMYNCPGNSYFNPTFNVCDTDYTCTCENLRTTAIASSEDVTELPTITISGTDVSITTVNNTDTAASVSVTVQLTEATTETCNYTSNLNYFECNSRGRFSNQNDPTCKTYFLCSLLRNGSYLKAMYNCPGNSYFNPTFNVCDTDYTCPCENLQTTVIASSEDVTELPTITISGTDVSITTVTNTDIAASVSVTVQLTETTTETCNYTSNLNYFECKSRGRFSNQNDPTCKTYFLCSLLRNGSYLKAMYNCPGNSYFNPTFNVCDTDYTCPCENLRTTAIASSENVTELPTITISGTDVSITTVTNTDIAASVSVTVQLTETTTETCNYTSNLNYFECKSRGRFSNQNDPTCKTYFLCSLLRNGSYLKAMYNCPGNSYFNPTFNVCDTDYTCPCENLRTTAIASSENVTELPTITISGTDVSITTVNNTDTIASVSVTVQLTEATTETCNYTSNLNYFECKSRGRFLNQNDPTCKTYFMCSLLKNGSYLKTTYNCPDTSYFNPVFQVCDSSYSCPCAEFLLSTTISSSEGVTELPLITISGTASVTTVNDSGTVQSVGVTTLTTEATTEACNYNSDTNYFQCNSTGRFLNQNDLTCQTYFLCSLLRNGSYLKTVYNCPGSSYFNPTFHVCDTSYTCPCEDLLTTAISSSENVTELATITISGTDVSITTVNNTDTTASVSVTVQSTEATTEICNYTGNLNYFECKSRGRFSNQNDPTCKTYFMCSLLRNGSYLKTKYSCPDTSYFNPTFQVCDTSYTCPCAELILTTTISSTEGVTELPLITISGTASVTTVNNSGTVASVGVTTEACNFNSDTNYFQCKSTGRFSNQNDLTCQTYFLCSLLRNGSYLKTTYTCPENSYFNPAFHVCDTSYTCPCKNLLTTAISSSEDVFQLPSSTISATNVSSVLLTTVNNTDTAASVSVTLRSTEAPTETCNYTSNLYYFECKSRGRFSNQNDPTCKTYFMCSLLRNGSYLKTTYNCPDTSYFNPIFQVCDTSYTCPCAELLL